MTYPSFNSGEVLTASDMNAVGLWLVKSTNFTTASTCPMESVFSSSYLNYLVKITMTGSANTFMNLVFYTGTNTEYTNATYYRYGAYYGSGAWTDYQAGNQTSMVLNNYSSTAANISNTELAVFAPNNSSFRTNIRNDSWDAQSGLLIRTENVVDVANSFTGFVVKPNTGTLTGRIRVYGYKD